MKTAVEELQRVLRDHVLEQEADAALVTSPQNRLYLTGFPSSAGWVLITPEKSYFLTDFRYFEAAERQVKSCEVVLLNNLSQNFCEIAQRHGINRVLVENVGLNLADAKTYREMFGFMGVKTVEDNTLDTAGAAEDPRFAGDYGRGVLAYPHNAAPRPDRARGCARDRILHAPQRSPGRGV